MTRALIIIARYPTPGQVKTRLCPPLSDVQASQLYECFLQDTLEQARAVADVSRFIAYTPREQQGYFRRLASDYCLLPQTGRDLGERLDDALTRCLRAGFTRVVIVGSDCPTLPAGHIDLAFDLLGEADVVLGPCDDGGYYLIGLRRPQPRLLRDVTMSTPEVLRDTLLLAEQEGLRVELTPPSYDVDTVDDLRRLRAELALSPGQVALHTRGFIQANALPGVW